jgi:hypothetical protein
MKGGRVYQQNSLYYASLQHLFLISPNRVLNKKYHYSFLCFLVLMNSHPSTNEKKQKETDN